MATPTSKTVTDVNTPEVKKLDLENAELKKAFFEMTKGLDEDFLHFEEDERTPVDDVWKKKAQGYIISSLLKARGIEFEVLAQLSLEKFKTAYVPNPAGLRTETLELYSKLMKKHDPLGWVPLQMVGPGLILGHFLPAYKRPDIPPYIANYVMITEKAYWDYQLQVGGMDIYDIRSQNGYSLITRETHPQFYKTIDDLSYLEFLGFLLCILHPASHEFQQVKELEKTASSESTIEDGLYELKTKLNNSYDVWVKSINAAKSDEFKELLNVDDDYLPVVNLEEIMINEDCKDLLQKYRVEFNKFQSMPFYITENSIGVASPKLDDPDVKSILSELVMPRRLVAYLTTERAYHNTEGALRQNLDSEQAVELFTQGMDIETASEQIEDIDAGQYTDNDDRVINFVNTILKNAIELQASDIHMEVTGGSFKLRFRIDGKMVPAFKPFPAELAPFAIRRIKILCKMDTSKNRIPGDGGLKIRLGKLKRTIDMRVATCPVVTSGGDGNFEKCVIRILDDQAGPSRLDEIMWIADQRETLKRVILQPYGIMIVTGPTGSGKSTTLYSVLNELNQPDVNIVTAEDPVERKVAGVNQTPVASPNTFAKTLRSFLRMDPDIILVGEIRDNETAELAIKASQTGHLVLTTLHANTALASIPRLDSLGVKRSDISSSLLMMSAQRLGRKLCKSCRRKRPLTHYEAARLAAKGVSTELVKAGYIYEARGCPLCGFRGSKGRIAIMELLEVTNDIRDKIEDETLSLGAMRKYVTEKHNFKNMYTNGLHAVARGEMDFTELLENIPDDSDLIIDITDPVTPSGTPTT